MLLKIPEIKSVEIEEKDVKISYYKDSGAGGQHRNKTMSCARIQYREHIVTCCQERDQRRNKKLAMEQLKEKVQIEYENQEKVKINEMISQQYQNGGNRGSSDRNYDFKRNTVYQDGRQYSLKKVMKGDLSEIYSDILGTTKE